MNPDNCVQGGTEALCTNIFQPFKLSAAILNG